MEGALVLLEELLVMEGALELLELFIVGALLPLAEPELVEGALLLFELEAEGALVLLLDPFRPLTAVLANSAAAAASRLMDKDMERLMLMLKLILLS